MTVCINVISSDILGHCFLSSSRSSVNRYKLRAVRIKLINCLISKDEMDTEKDDNGISLTITVLLKSRDFQVQHELYDNCN